MESWKARTSTGTAGLALPASPSVSWLVTLARSLVDTALGKATGARPHSGGVDGVPLPGLLAALMGFNRASRFSARVLSTVPAVAAVVVPVVPAAVPVVLGAARPR